MTFFYQILTYALCQYTWFFLFYLENIVFSFTFTYTN